jgi:hypothetical protein
VGQEVGATGHNNSHVDVCGMPALTATPLPLQAVGGAGAHLWSGRRTRSRVAVEGITPTRWAKHPGSTRCGSATALSLRSRSVAPREPPRAVAAIAPVVPECAPETGGLERF